MKWSIDIYDYRNLLRAVNVGISDALCKPKLNEPQIRANLVWTLPRAINAFSLGRKWTLKSGGVFVHSRPLVKFNNQKQVSVSVEIGDLLLLRTEVSGEKVTDRRALLLQAKKVSKFPVTPDNDDQHDLYANWPFFEYVYSTSALNKKKRHITGLDLHDASRFLLISDRTVEHFHCLECCYSFYPCFCEVMTASPTKPKLSHYRCFVSELVDFLLGDAGKAFKNPPPARTRNWDKVINDLVTVTAKRRSAFVKSPEGTTRGQGDVFFFLSREQPGDYGLLHALWGDGASLNEKANDGPPQVPAQWTKSDSENNGISVIEFIVSNERRAE